MLERRAARRTSAKAAADWRGNLSEVFRGRTGCGFGQFVLWFRIRCDRFDTVERGHPRGVIQIFEFVKTLHTGGERWRSVYWRRPSGDGYTSGAFTGKADKARNYRRPDTHFGRD